MNATVHPPTAVWALTPKGAHLARRIGEKLKGSTLFLSQKLTVSMDGAISFARLKDEVDRQFTQYSRHIFIMAMGIVVRSIAAHLSHKMKDPAVVVCDEAGAFAISLIAGHVGGANALAREVANAIGGQAVITTATDVSGVPAIDLIAVENDLTIENPQAIKSINMALLTGQPIAVCDPTGKVIHRLPRGQAILTDENALARNEAAVVVHYKRLDLPPHVLVLRPGSLVAGMGCNRGTALEEMQNLLEKTFARNQLAISSLRALATVDLKANEPGLLALAQSLNVSLKIFARDRLRAVEPVPTPSVRVEKHIGVKSVCEAAALLATHRGRLIVPKQKTRNVTLAVAADGFTSSASDLADRCT